MEVAKLVETLITIIKERGDGELTQEEMKYKVKKLLEEYLSINS